MGNAQGYRRKVLVERPERVATADKMIRIGDLDRAKREVEREARGALRGLRGLSETLRDLLHKGIR